MGRRALSRSIKRIPPSPAAVEKYLLVWSGEELHFHPERFPRLTGPAIFGSDRPMELEIGCGTAEFLCAEAAAHPERNYLGVDPLTKVLYFAAQQAEAANLGNIRFARATMDVLYPLLVPDSLAALHVQFPDPYVRNHGVHKVLNRRFVAAMHTALAPGASWCFVSDRRDLFQETLGFVEAHPGWERTHEDRLLVGFEPGVKSRYQRKWERYEDGQPLRFEVRKRALPAGAAPTGE